MAEPREFYVLIAEDEDGYYVAEAPELEGCYTQAKTLDELLVRIKEAIQLCLEDAEDHDTEVRPRIVGIQRVAV